MDLTVDGISMFLILKESRPHMLKWSSDDIIVFKHNTAS